MALPRCKHDPSKGCAVTCRQELWADLQFLNFHYVPRQDFSGYECVDAVLPNGIGGAGGRRRYVVVDREPHEDMVPRYILRERRDSDDERPRPGSKMDGLSNDEDDAWARGGGAPLLRVSLLDVDRFVSARDLERFENRLFELRVPDTSTLAAWRARLRERREKEERRRLAREARIAREEREERERERHRVVPSPWAEGVRVVVVVGEEPRPVEPGEDIKVTEQDAMSAPLEAAETDGLDVDGPLATLLDQAEDGKGSASGDGAAEEYIISRILNHKDIMGTVHFLCALEGLPDSQAMWMAEDELEDAEDAIGEYFERFQKDAEKYAPGEGGEEEEEEEESGDESASSEPNGPAANGGDGLAEGLAMVARRPSTIDDWVLSISLGLGKGRDGARTNGVLDGTDESRSSRT
jgi:hypothetical protein